MPGNILESFSDFLFPRTCPLCGRASDRPGRHVCAACLERIAFVPFKGCCRVCGRSVPGLDGEYLCEDCRLPSQRPAFDRAVSAVSFEGKTRNLLLDYKFNGRVHLVPDLVDWLEGAANAHFDVPLVDAVIPVMSVAKHRWNRGFDQVTYLARELARRLGRRYDAKSLVRVGAPARQGGLDEAARRENVKGTFVVVRPSWVRGRTLLLVDDIMTTGATLSEASRVLKSAGAARVWALAVARSLRD